MGMTRRDFVAALLGAAACRQLGARRTPPGTLVETGMQRGHRFVRDRAPIHATRRADHQVVIVGAGVAGLAAAWALQRRGVEQVVVLELDDVAGGTARNGRSS